MLEELPVQAENSSFSEITAHDLAAEFTYLKNEYDRQVLLSLLFTGKVKNEKCN